MFSSSGLRETEEEKRKWRGITKRLKRRSGEDISSNEKGSAGKLEEPAKLLRP